MKLAALIDGVCAICRAAPNAHARCAICEGSNHLVRVCAFCQAWNETNGVAWNDKRLDSVDESPDVERDDCKVTIARPLRDAMTPTRRRGRPRSARIDDAVIPRLLQRRERVLVERIDLEGRFRGTYERWERPSRREIARRSACSQHAVDRRYHDYTPGRIPDSRAIAARRLTKEMK